MRGGLSKTKVTGEVVNWGRFFDSEWELNAATLTNVIMTVLEHVH